MSRKDARMQCRATRPSKRAGAISAAILAVIAVMSTAACGGSKPAPHLSIKSGFDPCRDIPPSALNSWNANPTPKPAPSSESDGNTSTDPDLKSCEYGGKDVSSTQGLMLGDSLYVGLTRISLDYFHREVASGESYRDSEIDDRKMEIKGPYSTAHVPGRYTSCDIYVQMNGGGLLLTSVKTGDACKFLTDVAQKIVPLLPHSTPSSLAPFPSGFDPCRDIPSNVLNAWNINPTPVPEPEIDGDGISSPNMATKGCKYTRNHQPGQPPDTTTPLRVEITTMSTDYFRKVISEGVSYRETGIDGRKMAIKGPFGEDSGPPPFSECQVYVEMKGGGLMLSVLKSGDPCQYLTDFAQKIVPLLPPKS